MKFRQGPLYMCDQMIEEAARTDRLYPQSCIILMVRNMSARKSLEG